MTTALMTIFLVFAGASLLLMALGLVHQFNENLRLRKTLTKSIDEWQSEALRAFENCSDETAETMKKLIDDSESYDIHH